MSNGTKRGVSAAAIVSGDSARAPDAVDTGGLAAACHLLGDSFEGAVVFRLNVSTKFFARCACVLRTVLCYLRRGVRFGLCSSSTGFN